MSTTARSATTTEDRPDSAQTGSPYAWYVLGVLVVVFVFNFIDRQILSILAERIKADLQLSDAQLGFLYGTAFAVFYAIFGIPLWSFGGAASHTRRIHKARARPPSR